MLFKMCQWMSTWYTWYTGQPNNTQLVFPIYLVHRGQYTTYPTTDIDCLAYAEYHILLTYCIFNELRKHIWWTFKMMHYG